MLSRVILREGGLPRLVERVAIEEGVDEDDMRDAVHTRGRQKQRVVEAAATREGAAAVARGREAAARSGKRPTLIPCGSLDGNEYPLGSCVACYIGIGKAPTVASTYVYIYRWSTTPCRVVHITLFNIGYNDKAMFPQEMGVDGDAACLHSFL
jgi:hypothetical protein